MNRAILRKLLKSPRPKHYQFQQIDRSTNTLIHKYVTRIRQSGGSYYVRKKMDPLTVSNLQIELLRDIITAERHVKYITKSREKTRRLINCILVNNEPNNIKGILSKHNQALENYKNEENVWKDRISLLKFVGNAVAWILYDYDSIYIRNLSWRPPVQGFIIDKSGWLAEVDAWREILDSGKYKFCILHCITRCLRVGDISAKKGNAWYLIEVKSTKGAIDRPNPREKRQKQHLIVLSDYLSKGKSDRFVEGAVVKRINLQGFDKYNWSIAQRTLLTARKSGVAFNIVEDCMIYGCFLTSKTSIGDLDKTTTKWLGQTPRHQVVVDILNSHFGGELDIIMPFLLFDIRTDLIEDLLFHRLVFVTFLDLKRFVKLLVNNGLAATLTEQQITIVKGSNTLVVGEGLVVRLLCECLSIETAIKDIKQTINSMEDELE